MEAHRMATGAGAALRTSEGPSLYMMGWALGLLPCHRVELEVHFPLIIGFQV